MSQVNSWMSKQACTRRGFTLVETLLALALSSTLLVIVFSLIDSTLTYHVTGTDQVLVSQRLIGLMQDLRSDMRAVQADPHWQAIPAQQTILDEQLEAAKTRLTSQLQVENLERFAEPIRLNGQRDWLLLTLGYANPRWPNDSQVVQQVVWSLGDRGSLTVTTHDDRGRGTTQVIPGNAQASLTRTRIVANTKPKPSIQSEPVIAASGLAFRFLKNGRWYAAWNSSSEKSLPDAVEVSVQLTNDAVSRTWIIHTATLGEPGRAVK